MIDPASITPSVAEVASHIRSRTRDRHGREIGTFNADTRPTASDAGGHAQRAARHIAMQLGSPATEWAGDLLQTATDVAALYAALSIETSYYADGSAPDDSGTEQLGRMAREQRDALLATATNNQVGGRRTHSIRQRTARERSQPALDGGTAGGFYPCTIDGGDS